jgi:hypothetical protein
MEGKVKVIREIQKGKNGADVCQEFGLVNFTIQNIWKKVTKIFHALDRNGSRIKRFRELE